MPSFASKILVYMYPFKMPSYNLALMLVWFQKFVFGQLYFSFSYLSLPKRVVREEIFSFYLFVQITKKHFLQDSSRIFWDTDSLAA